MKQFKLLDTLTKDGYYLTQGYGLNRATYSKYGLLYHEGIDIGNRNKKIKVRTPVDGIIIQDWDTPKGNYGNYVVIWDDAQSCAIWICHLDENYVDYGQRVKAGDVIGEMGDTGNVTGEHIHMNFVQTNDRGVRLYRSEASNFGFLDPQHPLDPNPPKLPPGVPPYKIEWVESVIIDEPGEGEETMSKLLDFLSRQNEDDAIRDLAVLLGATDGKLDWGDQSPNRGGDLGAARRRIDELESSQQPISGDAPVIEGWENNGLQVRVNDKTWNYKKRIDV